MPKSVKGLIIGSTEVFSGKSAAVLGLAAQLQTLGFEIAYGKPISTCLGKDAAVADLDLEFIAQTLSIPESNLRAPLLSLNEPTIEAKLEHVSNGQPVQPLTEYAHHKGEDLLLIEGPSTLDEGALFDLSLPQIADAIAAPILLVARFHSLVVADTLIAAQHRLGSRLAGVIINDIPSDQIKSAEDKVKPFLESRGIPVLALLPRMPLMRSISVREIANRLNAEVICSQERLDLMVETLTIGAMNVNSALRYFRKGTNMAVVTGGDRTDLQLAALETSTHCLVLTGHIPPSPEIVSRAADLEVPILTVDSDTLTTVELIDELFGQVQLHEPSKAACIQELMSERFDLQRLMQIIDLKQPLTATHN